MKVDKSKWKRTNLAEVCKIQMGQSPDSSSYNKVRDGLPFYQGNADFGHHHPTPRIYCNKPTRIAQNGDLLISVRAPIGAINIANSDCCIGRGLASIQSLPNVSDIPFLKYLLHSKVGELNRKGTGMTFKAISKATLHELRVTLPPLNEQRGIAAELDAVQEMIDGYKAQLSDLDALAQSIFLDTFGDPISNPKGWEIVPLKSVSKIGTGSTPSRKKESYYSGDIPWVKSTEVNNSYIYSTSEHITQDAIDNSNCSIYPPETILVAMYGQGKTRGQVGFLKINATTNQACAAIQCRENLDPIFCYWHFQMCYDANRELGNGTNQKNMNLSIVGNLKFILPPFSLQQQFAMQIEAIEKQKDLLRQQLADAKTLMAERMQYYFS